MTRQFTHSPARRSRVPLLIGIIGASGSGKTYSALRLGTGIVRVSGGKLFGIDTETRRMAHYAPPEGQPPGKNTFAFEHVELTAPFNPLSYLECIRYCVKEGAGCIVIDSASHEHEGEGGVLDMHEAELDRISKRDDGSIDWKKRKAASGTAWIKPKAERRALVNGIMQLPPEVALIFCFRAQEKLDWKTKDADGKLVDLGWQPIAGGALVYEMTARCLLQPGADGVPDWNPKIPGENKLIKRPEQFRALFEKHKGKPLSEEMGEEMARWACGTPAGADMSRDGDKPRAVVNASGRVIGYVGNDARIAVDIASAGTPRDLKAIWTKLSPDQQNEFKPAFAERKAQMTQRQPGDD